MALSCVIIKLQKTETAKDRNCKKGKLQQTETELMVLAIVILFDTYVMLRSGRLGT